MQEDIMELRSAGTSVILRLWKAMLTQNFEDAVVCLAENRVQLRRGDSNAAGAGTVGSPSSAVAVKDLTLSLPVQVWEQQRGGEEHPRVPRERRWFHALK
jgi:hypothetical protein